MYWIVENGDNKNASNWAFFNCDKKSDINLMPTSKKEGINLSNDTVSSKCCALGSTCLCIEDGSVYILGTDGWQEI